MKPSEQELMAYVDGEADETLRHTIEAAALEDPAVARWIADQRALRARLRSTYDKVLDEPVPLRLQAAVRRPASRVWALPEWSAIAASLLVGLLIARALPERERNLLVSSDGRIAAGGALDRALQTQLGPAAGDAARIPLSFVSIDGEYCRAFSLEARSSGIACRRGDRWIIDTLGAMRERDDAQPLGGESGYRMAGGALAPDVIAAIERRIAGEPLDRAAERAASERGWQQR